MSAASRTESYLRGSWPWFLVAFVLISVFLVLISEHIGESVSASGATELSKDLINASGLLLAFTGIIFTGMLAEVRFRNDRATQAADASKLQRVERASVLLRRSAFASFLFFATSLAVAIGNLAGSIASPGKSFPMTQIFVVPSFSAFGGIAFLIVALAILATM